MNNDSIYIEIPVEMEADIAVQILTKQLETVEWCMQQSLEEANGEPHRGQDMTEWVRTRDALVRVINDNSLHEDKISNDWTK